MHVNMMASNDHDCAWLHALQHGSLLVIACRETHMFLQTALHRHKTCETIYDTFGGKLLQPARVLGHAHIIACPVGAETI